MNQAKSRREKINIMLNEEERKIIKEKAKKYGYGDKIAEYVRDACIYERIYVEEIKGKQEIFKIVNEFIVEIRKIQKHQLALDKNLSISKSQFDSIRTQNQKITDLIQKLIKTTASVLTTSSTQRFQKRMRLVEKYELTDSFIDKILSKETVIIIPSSLSIKKINDGYIIVYIDTEKKMNIDYINYNAISEFINIGRELAINDNYYLMIRNINKKLYTYLVSYTHEKEKIKAITDKSRKYLLYDCNFNKVVIESETNYSNN